jgi:hypothetical protein
LKGVREELVGELEMNSEESTGDEFGKDSRGEFCEDTRWRVEMNSMGIKRNFHKGLREELRTCALQT